MLPSPRCGIFSRGTRAQHLTLCVCVCDVCVCVWCPLDGCHALIGQTGTSVQLCSTVHLGQCTVLLYAYNSNSPHNTLSKLA